MLTALLIGTIAIPLLGSLLILCLIRHNEEILAKIAILATGLSSLSTLGAIGLWIAGKTSEFATAKLTLISYGSYHFDIGLVMNGTAAIFLLLVAFTSGTVIRFSRIYMHREPGFGRYFAVVLFFQAGMSLLTLAENLSLLFAGWEMVGLASFLLIAFYHERQSAVRNALKVFSIYRVADVGMLLSAFLEHTTGHTEVGFLLLLAAMGKSAQFPFSFWIIRAMEGPTPSSALFYGALSVHAGAYLLLRTYHLWQDIFAVHVAVGLIGILTAVFCSLFSRVQHTIKGQVGYASVTQVGFIFIELALGFKYLALFHIVSNALLRCYQLLISPSAAAYILRKQTTQQRVSAEESHSIFQTFFSPGFRSTLYVFAISEGYFEDWIYRIFWRPLGQLGDLFSRSQIWAVLGGFAVATSLFWVGGAHDSVIATFGFLLVAALFSVYGLGTWYRPLYSLVWLLLSLLMMVVAIAYAARTPRLGFVYGAGIVLFCAVALWGIKKALVGGQIFSRFAGISKDHFLATAFALMGVLGLSGFPFFPTFWTEDMLLHESFKNGSIFTVMLSCLFAFNSYLAMRTFALAFLGRQSQA